MRTEKLKQYGEILEEEAFVSEQRAYCQGYVDCIQLLAGFRTLEKIDGYGKNN